MTVHNERSEHDPSIKIIMLLSFNGKYSHAQIFETFYDIDFFFNIIKTMAKKLISMIINNVRQKVMEKILIDWSSLISKLLMKITVSCLPLYYGN